MKCPKCNYKTKVIDGVDTLNNKRYRKRKCINCGYMFYTSELVTVVSNSFLREWYLNHRSRKNKKG